MIYLRPLESAGVKHLLSKVKDSVSLFSGFDPKNINLRDSFKNDLGLDSLDLIDLSSSLEHELRIYLPEDVSHLSSVKALTKECIERLNHKKFRS